MASDPESANGMPPVDYAFSASPLCWTSVKKQFSYLGVTVTLLVGGLLTQPVDGAQRRKTKTKATPTAVPTPTPIPYLRAAGACAKYEPGQYLIVAEVGETGRAFHIDSETVLEVKPKLGTRVRIFYLDGPEGPVARRVMPGPTAVTAPPPGKPGN
jgi:hypothetical protein